MAGPLLTQPTTKAKSPSMAARQGRRVSHASLEVQVTATKKEPRAVHSRGLQLALFEALLSRRRRGCRGTGVNRRKGHLLDTLPNPARAIRDSHHNLQHFEQSRRIGRNSRRSISPAEPLWCRIRALTIHMGNGSVGKDLEKLC